MTWSIIAHDAEAGHIGIAVASKFLAVGALVPAIKSGVGAIASQAFINPMFRARGLALLSAGATPDDVVRLLQVADEGRDHRQVHVMDREGRTAAYTGAACVDWCGHRVAPGLSIAGNMLAGDTVIDATLAAYQAANDLPLGRRLIAAMQAGEAAGGDKRGKQAAAVLIHDEEDYPLLDLRVDDAAEPLAELERLAGIAETRWAHFRKLMPGRANPTGLLNREEREAAIPAAIAETGNT
ncbi:MAG: DUF1028 domain-containing protein [Hyphomicrobiaceae bacterium]|nr:DUF1028 domain-containing protein [Hyphomicrobiaceae bacterium]